MPDLKYCVRKFVRKNDRRYVRKNDRRYVRRNVKRICQKICQKECQKICQKDVRKNVRNICQKECQKICQKECQKDMSERMSEDMSEIMSEDVPERMSKDMSQRMSGDMPEDIAERMSKDMSERMSEDMSERMSEDMSEEMSERYVRNHVKRKVRKNVRRYVRKNVRNHVRRCARKNVRRYVRKNVKRYVRKNGKRYVRKNVRRYKDSCLHLVVSILLIASCFFCFIWRTAASHCSKYCWLNFVFVQGSEFGLAAMAEVVVERPETIFIGTANQVAKGVEHVWRYKLTPVGAERMYVCMEPPSTTHAGDLMFIMEEVVEGNKWYVAYEGRPVPNAEGEQELEKRAAVFRTSASFWEDGVHEWETNDVRSRATYTEEVKEPQWQASGFMVCTRHEM